jgi:sodium transport system permease protein
MSPTTLSPPPVPGWRTFLVVSRKEFVDALRDRRTLLMVLLSSVAMGPLVLLMLSGLVGSLEARAERRVVVAQGIEAAPTLRNFIERQGYTLQVAPDDAEQALREGRLGDPVLRVPADFESKLARGEPVELVIVTDGANRHAEAGSGTLRRLLQGFGRERVSLTLAMRGIAPQVLQPLEVLEQDLASAGSRAAMFMSFVPFFVLMGVVYGALPAALDATAGERERGSLEPLLMTPGGTLALVLGKWAAVAGLGMTVALLGCLSFLPGQWMLRSETLAANFRFGPWEAAGFLAVLWPLAAALAALLMLVAIRCRSHKEAQASSTGVVLVVSLLPLVTMFGTGGEQRWHLWVPVLAQNTLMNRVLKGEALEAVHVLVPLGTCVLISAVALWGVARLLRAVAVR